MKKKLARELRKVATEMPVIMRHSNEVHLVKGSEMIANGVYDVPNPRAGEPLQPERIKVIPEMSYKQPVPVQIAINHTRKLKKLHKQMGYMGLHAYVDAIIKHAASSETPLETSAHLQR